MWFHLKRELKTAFLRDTGGIFGLQIIAVALELSLSLVLARTLGAASYGAYETARAWVGVLGVFAALGLPQLIVREVSVYRSAGYFSGIKGLWQFSLTTTFSISLLLVILTIGATSLLYTGTILQATWICLAAVPVAAFLSLGQSMLQGVEQVVRSQVANRFVRPGSFLVLVCLVVLLSPVKVTAEIVAVLYVTATAIGFGVVLWWIYRELPEAVWTADAEYAYSDWSRSAFPLLFIAGTQILIARTDIIMLGAFQGGSDAGIYAIAAKGATLVAFPLLAVNKPLAPRIARLYSNNDPQKVQNTVRRAARIAILAAVPGVVFYVIFGEAILGIFGSSFSDAHLALIILACGHLLDTACGPSGLFLNMVGREKETAYAKGISAALNISLNLVLIPYYGIYGAAVASVISLAGPNIYLLAVSIRKEGVNTSFI